MVSNYVDLFPLLPTLEELARQKVPMLRNVSDYWRTNLFETTSGNFATDVLLLHKKALGLDRIMYSVDYPFVPIAQGTEWVNGLEGTLTPEELLSLKRGTAIKLLKLDSN